MKKFALRAVAAAAFGLASSTAFAVYDIDANTGALTFASELNYTSAGTALAATTVTTKLGFGVSASQNRYIRVDLSGSKFAAAASTVPADMTANSGFVSSVLVSGGAVNDTFAIYQITANATIGAQATDSITLTLPTVYVTNGNAASLNVTYSLYETATAAVANAPATQLYQSTGGFAKFGAGLKWTLTPAKNTATVASSFKKFSPSTLGPVALGLLTYGVNSGVAKASGGAVALTDLVTAATAINFVGDFTAVGTAPALFLDANDSCGTSPNDLTAGLNAGKNAVSFTVGTTAKIANLCYTVTGNTVIPVETITAALAVVPAASTTTASVAAATLGTIDHDGTTLLTPYANVNPSYVNRFIFTNSSGGVAAWSAVITTEPGVTCTNGVTSGTLQIGTNLIDAASLVTGCTGAPRFSVTFNIAAPRQYIEGVYTSADKLGNAAASAIRLTAPVTVAGTN